MGRVSDIVLSVAGLIVLATLLCWLLFFLNIIIMSLIRMDFDLFVPAIFSVFVTGLVFAYIYKETRAGDSVSPQS